LLLKTVDCVIKLFLKKRKKKDVVINANQFTKKLLKQARKEAYNIKTQGDNVKPIIDRLYQEFLNNNNK